MVNTQPRHMGKPVRTRSKSQVGKRPVPRHMRAEEVLAAFTTGQITKLDRLGNLAVEPTLEPDQLKELIQEEDRQLQRSDENENNLDAKKVGGSAALMSVLVMISRITGFLRTWSQAYAIGVTVLASAYSIANNLPNQLYELVVAGMLTTAFLPVYMNVKRKAGAAGASRYTSNLVSIVLLLMGAVTILGFIFAGEMVYTQAFTATADFDFNLTVYFFRFFVIEVVLYALSSIFSGVLNAERDYFWGAAAPIFNNFILMASFMLYAFLVPTNPQLALIILAIGNPLGVAVQLLLQILPLKKHNIHISWHIDLHDPYLKDTLRIGIPSLVVMVTSFITTSVQSAAALSVLATGASITYYARLWYTLPYAILTVPITTAMFTELSDTWAKGNQSAFKKGMTEGFTQILFFMIPFMMYLIVFSNPLISILASGKFNTEALAQTTSYLAVYSLTLPFYALTMYFQKVTSAMCRMKAYAWVSVIASTVQVVILLVFTSQFGLNFVGFSSTLFFLLCDVLILFYLRKYLGALGLKKVFISCVRITVFGLAGASIGFLIVTFFKHLWALDYFGGIQGVICCVVGGIPAVVVTYGLAMLFKVPEAALLNSLLRRILPSKS